MATHLGVASDFASVDLHDGHLSSAQVVYLEGYLWEQPSAKAAMREAIEMAHAGDASVALTVSDPFCVEHHRREFLELLTGDLEMLFANEEEVMSLFGSATFEAAVEAVVETGVLAVLTRGAAGCVVVTAVGTGGGARRPGGPGGRHHRCRRPVRRRLPLRHHQRALRPRTPPAWAGVRRRGHLPRRVPGPRPTSGPWPWRPACSILSSAGLGHRTGRVSWSHAVGGR